MAVACPRWWALVVSQKRTLPSADKMRSHAAWGAKASASMSQPSRTTMSYVNSLARHEVGCEPDMFKRIDRNHDKFITVRELILALRTDETIATFLGL